MATVRLPFEKEIYQMEDSLADLESQGQTASEEIRQIRRELVGLKRKV